MVAAPRRRDRARRAARRRALLPACALAFACALALATAATAAADWAVPLHACGGRASDREQCGRVRVPLDRSGRVPGAVDLNVRVLDPPSGAPVATVLALAGGPGQAAAPFLDRFASGFGPASRTRRFVAFDQRGTGGSGRLACRALAGSASAAAVAACAQELGPARTQYTTAASVADVEAVRAALGVERLVLYGTSYGTKVALDYAAAHPQHVERLVLDSVVLPEGVDPFQRTTLASVPRVLRTLCRGACAFTRDVVADVARLVRRLRDGPLRGPLVGPRGDVRHVGAGRAELLALLLAGDLAPHLRAGFPAAVGAALRGDAAPLLRLLGSARDDADDDDGDALYLATTCADGGVPWPAGTPVAQRRAATDAAAAALPESTFAPFDRETVRALGIADACRGWPESPIAQPTAPLPDVPALILSGDDDLRTPRSDAQVLASRLPRSELLQVPNAGHAVLGSDPTDCAEKAVGAFLAGNVPGRCRGGARPLPASDLPPARLADVAPPRGVAGRRGRTVAAVGRTLADATDQVIAQVLATGGATRAFGGLRAGSAALDPRRGLVLRGYAFVPGVTLTGVVPSRGSSFTLTVGGAAASHGRLTFSRAGVRGTLDGRRLRVAPAAIGWRAPGARASAAARADAARAAAALASPFRLDGTAGR